MSDVDKLIDRLEQTAKSFDFDKLPRSAYVCRKAAQALRGLELIRRGHVEELSEKDNALRDQRRELRELQAEVNRCHSMDGWIGEKYKEAMAENERLKRQIEAMERADDRYTKV